MKRHIINKSREIRFHRFQIFPNIKNMFIFFVTNFSIGQGTIKILFAG